MDISVSAEKLFTVLGFPVSNSLLTTILVSLVLIWFAALFQENLRQIPRRFQAAIEMMYELLLNTCESVIGRKDVAREIFPFVATQFLFILLSNYTGLIPGFGSLTTDAHPIFRAPTSDLNTTVALAVITVIYIQYLGIKHLGAREYASRFFTKSSIIDGMVGFQELISEFIRIISFSFRLFGNIFAGEVMIAVVTWLMISYFPYVAILPLPFYLLEIFVGLIQAVVFSFLTIIFTSLAVTSHHAPDPAHAEMVAS